MSARETESISINIRAKKSQRAVIDRAAELLHRSRSDFMLEVAYREAENVLLDHALFVVDATTFEKFQTALEAPMPTTEKLRQLLEKKAPWDKK